MRLDFLVTLIRRLPYRQVAVSTAYSVGIGGEDLLLRLVFSLIPLTIGCGLRYLQVFGSPVVARLVGCAFRRFQGAQRSSLLVFLV